MAHTVPHDTASSFWKRNMALILAIFLCYSVYSMFFSVHISITPAADHMTVTFPVKESFTDTIAFSDITAVSLTEISDFGIPVSGGDSGRYCWGSWENTAWGEYTLCISTSHSTCLVVDTVHGVYVINYPKKGDTTAFYTALKDYLRSNGYASVFFDP